MKVSVIIPTYKRSTYLYSAIESVLKQTYQNIEVIVVDDNDPDSEWREKTKKVINEYSNDKRVRYIEHPKNMNGAVARNTGIKAASGEVICFLDDDDKYRENRIKEVVDFFESNKDMHAVYCGWNRYGNDFIPNLEGNLAYEVLCGDLVILSNSISILKEDAIKIGGWDEELRRNQEAGFLLRYFLNGGKIGKIQKVLIDYNMDDRSNVSNPKQNEMDYCIFLRKYIDLVCANEKQKKHAYVSRMTGVMLLYLKSKKTTDALRIFTKLILFAPFFSIKHLVKYCLKRVFNYYPV